MATKIVIALAILTGVAVADRPCAVRQIPGQSVVCVCNETYCDDITRLRPGPGHYVAYTSSEAGSRFKKHKGEFHSYYMWNEGCSHTLVIDQTKKSQTIEGFGGAVTDSAGINWASLTPRLQSHVVNSYFGKHGLEYNMLRVPIGSCDFSTHDYAYNELPWHDSQLSNFTLSPEDFHYKIPMIQHIKAVATADIHVLASVWSPPPWMKTNEKSKGRSFIKPEYFQTFADYFAKFIREYKKHDIDVWGVTTTNEPENAELEALVRFQTLGWSPEKMGKWIVENLGPTLKNSTDLNHVKILTVDDQRFTLPMWFSVMITEVPEVLNWFDGVAVHWYGDKFTPAAFLDLVTKYHPEKFVISTEACEGSEPTAKEKVSLGNWSRAVNYVKDILEDLNHNLVGWIDWNLCLDKQGGPNWSENYVDSPVIVFPENDEFVKQPMFYAMGHFSKWIPRGSVRLEVEERKGLLEKSVKHVAFLTPQNTVVLVVYNEKHARKVRVQLGEDHAVVKLEKTSFTTVEFLAPGPQ